MRSSIRAYAIDVDEPGTIHPPQAAGPLPLLFSEAPPTRPVLRLALRHAAAWLGAAIILLLAVVALSAPLLTDIDPLRIDPLTRLKPPSGAHWFGTDMY